MADLVRKEIWDIFETKNSTRGQIRKYKRNEKELDKNCAKSRHVFFRSDLMARMIKNSRGEKKKPNNNNNNNNKRLYDITINKGERGATKIVKAFLNESILPLHSVFKLSN